MSRKYLLPVNLNAYKANLHCHSTFSDGKLTVEQLKEMYVAKGYSIIAFSDHNKLVPHNELRDNNFLPINSIEIDLNMPTNDWYHAKTYHLNFFSKDPDRNEFIPLSREYSVENANKLLKDAKDAGFLTQYNHPRWSLQTSEDFLPLDNLWSFEIYNTGCQKEMINGWGDYEYEATCREFFAKNKELPVPVATDDNHNQQSAPYDDSFGGWSVIFAESLDYSSVIEAMENKNIYASTGPEIYELYSEDGYITVKSSPCMAVALLGSGRPTSIVRSTDDTLTETKLQIPHNTKYVRIQLTDKYNNMAFSRPYTIEEL